MLHLKPSHPLDLLRTKVCDDGKLDTRVLYGPRTRESRGSEGAGPSEREKRKRYSLLAKDVPETRDRVLGVLHELVFRLVSNVL